MKPSIRISWVLLPDLHNMLIHFPVVLFLVAAGCDLLSYFQQDPFFDRAGWWILSLAILTTALAVASGYLAESLVHWPPALHARIERMEQLGWMTLVAGTATWSLRAWTRRHQDKEHTKSVMLRWGSTGLLGGTIVLLTLTAQPARRWCFTPGSVL